MDINIYTDFEDKDSILIDLSSLIRAYEYAVKMGNQEVASLLKPLFSQNCEKIKIAKTSPIYTFLTSCPNTKIEEIDFQKIIEAFVVSRLQNNKPILQKLGNVIGHWHQYVLEGNELEGITKEMIDLPKEVKDYIYKYHDIGAYIKQVREQPNTKPEVSKVVSMNSFVEIGDYEKIYIKDKTA